MSTRNGRPQSQSPLQEPVTIEDMLRSRPVCYPFNLLNICLVTDAGGAVVLTRADRAKDVLKNRYISGGRGRGVNTSRCLR